MADSPLHPWLELLKLPVTVFSILVALIIAKHALGLGFGDVSEISASGVKFEKAAGREIAELNSRLNGALAAIEELRKSAPAALAAAPAQAAVFEASQTVSDQAARLADVSTPARPGAAIRGFIWIGDHDGRQWQRVKIAWPATGQPVDTAPAALQPGTEYKLLANMVVRDGQPANDAAYFNGRRSLGIAPTGSRVRLLRPPVLADRPFAQQYWAEVEVL